MGTYMFVAFAILIIIAAFVITKEIVSWLWGVKDVVRCLNEVVILLHHQKDIVSRLDLLLEVQEQSRVSKDIVTTDPFERYKPPQA